MDGSDDAPVGTRHLLRLAGGFLRPHRVALALALAGMLLQSLLLLPVPLLQGWVLDRLADGAREHAGAGLTAVVALALAASVGCYLLRAAVGWSVAATMHRVSLEVVRDLTDAMHRKLQRQPLAYYDRRPTGELMARLTGDVGSLLVFLNGGALQLVCDLILAGGVAGVLLWLQWRLALVAFLVVPVVALNHRRCAALVRRLSRAVTEQTTALYALLSERVSAVRIVRAFAQEPAELAELDRRLDGHRAASDSLLRAGAWQTALSALVGGLGTVSVISYGVVLVRDGRLTVGELLAFYALLAQLYQPIVRLAGAQTMIAGTLVAVDRILEVLDAPEAETNRPGVLPLTTRPRGALAFRDVAFAYLSRGPRVLDGINLTVEPGETLGILGASGAGKSTLLALAGRFYDLGPGGGEILFDGLDVRSLRQADLRRAVALVPQQAVLFEGTIRSNLTYAASDAAESDLWRALEAADLVRLITGLPQGLATPVGERGFTLSGGQRQRLALARALLTDPTVLLLDDCTSALDAATEARVHVALDEFWPERTRLVVSHKVATVARADRIVVLEAGRVVEEGTHGELLALGRRYAETFRQQSRALAGAAV
jgi:ABC-type multidrug transport system fused ATPase/permease subunit